MFKSHLIKVLVGFCGMILLGLISLVIIDSYKGADASDKTAASSNTRVK